MNKIIYYILLIFLVGCYNDEGVQTLQSENNAHRNSELTKLVKSISVHNASFDDFIDNTSCFSIKFPYQIQVNSELRNITSEQDILELSNTEQIEIVYPVKAIFYNYEEHNIVSGTDFNLVKSVCDENFNIQHNYCLDIQYPIVLKEFNDLTQSFETFQLNTDRQVFRHLENLHDNDIFEIEYPIFLLDSSSNSIRINSNSHFIAVFNESQQNCE
ncbi:MAG: hypothetical protein KGY51_05870 [Psychroflexus sp.]|nr:hypothetical protein [Psychroflexus sp.]